MTKQLQLQLYKKALIDWKKPISKCQRNKTDDGFCYYFMSLQNVHFEELKLLFSFGKLYMAFDEVPYYFEGTGSDIEGRTARINALEKAIEYLENELKNEQQ